MFELESQIRKWRGHLRSSGSLREQDLEELESHLRDNIDDLTARGVTTEEAFLIAVRRMGDTEALSNEFAKVTTESLWRQLLVPAPDEGARRRQRTEVVLLVGLAIMAGLLGKIPALFGLDVTDEDPLVYLKNASLFAFPSVAVYLIWKRSLSLRFMVLAGTVFVAAALLVNLYPSYEPHQTAALMALHLPIALLLLGAVLYGGPGWRKTGPRLDFVRFAGEVFIYSILIGLGGVALVAVSVGVFQFVDIDIEAFVANWVVIFGGCAILVVAAYLVERKMGRIESIAPVLARIFTPLLLVVLVCLLLAMLVSGRAPAQDRELLIWFDLLLALAVGMTLYGMSARDAEEPAGLWDILVLALVVVALIVDGVAMSGMISRLAEYGASPNKLAGLGANVLLLVNLVLLGIGYVRFVAGRVRYQVIVEAQMRYLPIYALWAACVVIVFPPLFGFQ
ncbi:MAG: permease prefix domain 1-containing protein [Actinomycetia bacterium]|nr:permease prefix domain 1-containing protein [Actinomycetes bacterium]